MLSTPASSTTLAIPTTSWTVIPPATKDTPSPNINCSKITVPREILPKKSFEDVLPPFAESTILSGTVSCSSSRRKKSTSEPVPTNSTPKRSRQQAKAANKDLIDEQCRKAIALCTVGLESVTDYQLRKTLKPLLDCEKIDRKSLQPNKL